MNILLEGYSRWRKFMDVVREDMQGVVVTVEDAEELERWSFNESLWLENPGEAERGPVLCEKLIFLCEQSPL